MNNLIKEVREELFMMQDMKYRNFQSSLMPNVEIDTIIGVRTPQLRSMAKRLAKRVDIAVFLADLPHKYYEENNIHGFIISEIRDFKQVIAAMDTFFPYIDNWATCDQIRPKVFEKHLEELIPEIKRWIASEKTYTVRFGIEMLMTFYLDKHFETEYLNLVAAVKSKEYYVNMMKAWYFATALAKQYDAALPYIRGRLLDIWTHNKTIQKAIESYRVTDEHKEELRELKIKNG